MAIEVEHFAVDAGDHVVHFYEHESELAATVGRYLSDAVGAGGVAVVIATEAHRRALAGAGVDPVASRREGKVVWLDAAATLARFMPRGRIDGGAFREVVGGVMRAAGAAGRPVCAYGEMVALLWNAGDVLAVIELEKLWNELGGELRFSLWCGYELASVQGDGHEGALREVCHLHSAVVPPCPRDDGGAGGAAPGVEVAAHFMANREAPGLARHFVADALGRWGHAGELLDDAQLLVTELATNAVVHARSPFDVVVRDDEAGVRVSVRDASPVMPTLRDGGPTEVSGRGLHLIAALSTDWGVDVTADGKTVWAQLQP